MDQWELEPLDLTGAGLEAMAYHMWAHMVPQVPVRARCMGVLFPVFLSHGT